MVIGLKKIAEPPISWNDIKSLLEDLDKVKIVLDARKRVEAKNLFNDLLVKDRQHLGFTALQIDRIFEQFYRKLVVIYKEYEFNKNREKIKFDELLGKDLVDLIYELGR